MKRIFKISAFLVFTLTFFSFQLPNPSTETIFQEALNIKELEKHFEKNTEGEFLPLTIVTNNFFNNPLNLHYKGQKVKIVEDKNLLNQERNSILELTAMKFKGKKSTLYFKYGEKNIKIRLKQIGGEWVSRTISVKWKNGFRTVMISNEETTF